MDNFIYINACKTTLANEITNTQTTIQVSNPGRFPASIPLGQVLVLTIHPDGLPSTQEIVHCTAISGDVLTVVRGAQSTAAVPWPEGTVIGAYLTAEMLAQIANDVRGHAGSGGSAHALATTVAAGFMSAANVVKLAGIQAEATKYIHPITHSPTIIAQDLNNRFVTDAEKSNWNAAKNHADSPHAPSNAQKNSDITKEEIEAKFTGPLMQRIPAGQALPTQDIGPIWHDVYNSIMTWQVFNANGANYIGYASVLIGAPIFDAQPTPRAGYIKSGTSNLSRVAYSALRNWAIHNGIFVEKEFWVAGTVAVRDNEDGITFTIYDLRGEFFRAGDDGRGIDVGRILGSWQEDTFQGHWHRMTTGRSDVWPYHAAGSAAGHVGNGYYQNFDAGTGWVRGPEQDGVNGAPRIGRETRPRNCALLACIKY
ncbi:MAG: hypothetical protein V3573_14415 [Desulfovibrionaceae bacterium]